MTSCSLTRIEGLLQIRVTGEGDASFYLILLISPRISLLSQVEAVCRESDDHMMLSMPIWNRFATPIGSSINVAETWRWKSSLGFSFREVGGMERDDSCA